ncbi:MAG: mercuric reductase [Vulcanimicrobiaceae bacterium]
MPRMDTLYDLCVIGAGTAGFAAAQAARADGASVVLVSGPGDLGGTCILRGCMPVKTLLSSTERLGEVDRAEHLGVHVSAERLDLRQVVARKRELVDYFAADRRHELEEFPLVRGCACFVSRDTIVAGETTLRARAFVVATGSTIVPPPIDGLTRDAYFTSDGALEMTHVPRRLAVVGAGPVGCEFAQYFARLGSHVTLFQNESAILRKEDRDVADAVAAALGGDGVRLRTNATIDRYGRDGALATLDFHDDDGAHRLGVDAVMVATERRPNVAGLGLDAAGVAVTAQGIAVDATLRTSNPTIYAAGDVLGRRCLVHVAMYAGALAARNALGARAATAEFDRFEAHAVYTQPQVAVAGLTERTCRERGLAIDVRHHPFSDVGKALVSDVACGFVKMIAAPDGRVLGVAIVGDDAIDLIGEAIALIDRGATTTQIAEMPHLHPTLGEIFVRVAEDFERAGDDQPPAPPLASLGLAAERRSSG